MSMRTLMALAAAAAVLAACGERSQVVEYKQGQYSGKSDAQPWASAPFNGDKQAWENQVRARNQNQNEYRRMGG